MASTDLTNTLRILQDTQRLGAYRLSVGVQGKEAQEQHRGSEPGVSVGQVAFENYYGAPGTPARPWMRVAAERHKQEWAKVSRAAVQAVTRGRLDAEQALELVGVNVVGKIQESMSDGIPPPNSPATIARKGSSKPLIDTGHLRQAHTSVVEKV